MVHPVVTSRARTFSKWVLRNCKDDGITDVCRGAPRFLRQRLPSGIWPPLLIDPRHAADRVVSLPEKPPLEVTYRGDTETLPRQLSNFVGRIDGPENAVYVFEDAEVVGRHPVTHIDGKILLPSWFGVDTAFFLHQNKFLKRNYPLTRVLKNVGSNPDAARRIETAFLLLSERGSNRYGWFHETIPKIKWYEEYCELTGKSPPLIVNSPLSEFQRLSLELLGYDSNSWIEHGSELSRVDQLVVAPHPIRLEGNPSSGFAAKLQWAGDRIRSNCDGAASTFPDRIYISREDAYRRRVTNEAAVLRFLERRGFESYEPGRLSFEEQVRLFADANVIVGLHGLAYYNLMFCTEGTKLLELFAEDGVDESYFVVANELNMDYEYMTCEPTETATHKRPINRDVHIDTDRLGETLDDLVDGSDTPAHRQTPH